MNEQRRILDEQIAEKKARKLSEKQQAINDNQNLYDPFHKEKGEKNKEIE